MIASRTSSYLVRFTGAIHNMQQTMDRLAKGYECVADEQFEINLNTFQITKKSPHQRANTHELSKLTRTKV